MREEEERGRGEKRNKSHIGETGNEYRQLIVGAPSVIANRCRVKQSRFP